MKRLRHTFAGRLLADPLAALALAIIVALVLVVILADIVAPHEYMTMHMADRFAAPSATYWLGTDNLGRDTFSRLLQGGRIALFVGIAAVAISGVIGLVLGMIAGFAPRWLDNALLFFFDTTRAYPTIILALGLAALMPRGLTTVILVVVITSFSEYARVVRTQTLSLRNAEFILAERAMGASFTRLVLHQVLPNVVGPFFILAAMNLPVVITIEAGMSFLGVGVPPGTPSWGATLKDGFDFIRSTPWIIIAGGIPLILVTLGFTFMGEALRDQLDPKLRKAR